MGVAENVRLTTTFQDAYNARDWDALRGALAESVVVHDPAEPEPFRGRQSVLQMLQKSVEFFPTSRIEGVHQFGQPDQVCVENVETGARKNSDKRNQIRTCYTFKVDGGELTAIRFYYDARDMMRQIGMSLSGGP